MRVLLLLITMLLFAACNPVIQTAGKYEALGAVLPDLINTHADNLLKCKVEACKPAVVSGANLISALDTVYKE